MERKILFHYTCFALYLASLYAKPMVIFTDPFPCKKPLGFNEFQRQTIQHFQNEERKHADQVLDQYTKFPYPPITIPHLIRERNTYASGHTVFSNGPFDMLDRINATIFKGKAGLT